MTPKIVLITGASSGIGKAAARMLAEQPDGVDVNEMIIRPTAQV